MTRKCYATTHKYNTVTHDTNTYGIVRGRILKECWSNLAGCRDEHWYCRPFRSIILRQRPVLVTRYLPTHSKGLSGLFSANRDSTSSNTLCRGPFCKYARSSLAFLSISVSGAVSDVFKSPRPNPGQNEEVPA